MFLVKQFAQKVSTASNQAPSSLEQRDGRPNDSTHGACCHCQDCAHPINPLRYEAIGFAVFLGYASAFAYVVGSVLLGILRY